MNPDRDNSIPADEDHLIRSALERARHRVAPADWDAVVRRAATPSVRRSAIAVSRRMVAVLGILAVAAVGGVWMLAMSRDVKSSTPVAQPAWTEWTDRSAGISVRYPSRWSRATRVLTPGLSDPREILTLGTGPMIPSPNGDNMPSAAVAAMRPTDVLISLQEGSADQAPLDRLQARRSFDLTRGYRAAPPLQGVVVSAGRVWWILFKDQGRGFHLLVVVGDKAPPEALAQVEQTLESLRFVRRAGPTARP